MHNMKIEMIRIDDEYPQQQTFYLTSPALLAGPGLAG